MRFFEMATNVPGTLTQQGKKLFGTVLDFEFRHPHLTRLATLMLLTQTCYAITTLLCDSPQPEQNKCLDENSPALFMWYGQMYALSAELIKELCKNFTSPGFDLPEGVKMGCFPEAYHQSFNPK